ncbi:MAG: dihydrofolate reductase [Bacteroidetes bacterium GWF2_33_38]|nr:MAG: dihydrofolate reductase [Bacteroidetes bacterium GWF2_33_38]OFY72839.1 MAG: dihydrofolate reductase [Bacteroidetes bacterium RIFOXYA12_FULL_33_9]OFY91386.1 MAG: dihydrofolate reductase [Bacteroidetes bacterium RIFOXYA2_FULL_33_7]
MGYIACNNSESNQNVEIKDSTVVADDFKYLIEQFADIKIMRYQIPEFELLSIKQKELIYYLSEAAYWGRDITFDQNYKHNLFVRRTLEEIYKNYNGDKNSENFRHFEDYLKIVWFSNGIHHHYSTDKIIPDFSKEYLVELIKNSPNAKFPLDEGKNIDDLIIKITPILYDTNIASKRVSQDSKKDLVTTSANNFYEGVTQKEVEAYYATKKSPNEEKPWTIGINTKVVKENGVLKEQIWKISGMYGKAIEKIVYYLEKAAVVAENENQKAHINKLIEYYKTGDLQAWDDYNVLWVSDLESSVDYVNGFIENYGDPMSRKSTWESVVNFKNIEATKRTKIISDNAQWFEDHSPIDNKFKKKEVKGVSAKVITVAALGGDCYPSTPIGINLPNADWIRKYHGSKSVTMENITYAYDKASLGNGFLEEFAFSEEEIALAKNFGPQAGNIHTDMHECLGHGSGQLLPGVSSEALKNYQSPLEEARADLFALYYMMDDKMVETGLFKSLDIAKAEYNSYIRNGLMTQLTRIKPGKTIEQAHMRNRQLIAKWCFEKGQSEKIITKETKDNKTYFVINDHVKLRELFGQLLKEIQRIKSEGDYEAGKNLIETYAVQVDAELHAEVLARFEKLKVAPYGGFVNPKLVPVFEGDKMVDVKVEYPDNYAKQMLEYSEKYSILPTYN